MKMWTRQSLVLGFIAFGAVPASAAPENKKASNTAPVSAVSSKSVEDEEPAEAELTWADQKVQLQSLEAQFKDKNLSNKEKVKLVTKGNALLAEIPDLEVTPAQKKEEIAVIVSFIAASIESDSNNSHTNTMFEHYKQNKKVYEAEISKLASKDVQKKIRQAFQDWMEFEKESAKVDAENESDN